MATDPQSLFNVAGCKICFSGCSDDESLELALLSQILTSLNPMAATDPQSLMTAGKCYGCYGASMYEIMKLSLLSQISTAHNPENDVTPQGLVSLGKCFPCFSAVSSSRLMELALLAQIAT